MPLPQSSEEVTLQQLAYGLEPRVHTRAGRHYELEPNSDVLANLGRYYNHELDHSQMTEDSVIAVGVVVENITPSSPSEEAPAEPRFSSRDPDYRAGQARGILLVWHPRHHISVFEPSCLPMDQISLKERMAFDRCTRVYGPYEYIKKIKYLSIVNIEYPNIADKTYAILRVNEEVDPSELPKVKMQKPETNSPKLGSDDAFKESVQDEIDVDEVLSTLDQGVPAPEDRPSPKSKNVYHTSVDKELLKYPSPEHGYQDWTGAGEGTVSKTKGRQASGKPCHYLNGTEVDEKGKVIVSLPADLSFFNKGWMKIHRAALEPYRALVNQARSDGVPAPCLLAYSTFRSLKEQRASFRRYFFGKYGGKKEYPIYDFSKDGVKGIHKMQVAAYRACRIYNGDPDDPALISRGIGPGGDHLCGRGIDMFLGVDQNTWANNYQKKHNVKRGVANAAFKEFMKKSNVYKWLEINAEFFGFYNYHKEPWHWAYNPDDRPNRQGAPDRSADPLGLNSVLGEEDSNIDDILNDSENLINEGD